MSSLLFTVKFGAFHFLTDTALWLGSIHDRFRPSLGTLESTKKTSFEPRFDLHGFHQLSAFGCWTLTISHHHNRSCSHCRFESSDFSLLSIYDGLITFHDHRSFLCLKTGCPWLPTQGQFSSPPGHLPLYLTTFHSTWPPSMLSVVYACLDHTDMDAAVFDRTQPDTTDSST